MGIDHDTAAFAVESIRRWWHELGQSAIHGQSALWQCGGQQRRPGPAVEMRSSEELGHETGMAITVAHLPPGTSKWNRIEHRLFAFITQNWRAAIHSSHQVIVQLIGATTTKTGLSVACTIDDSLYPKGVAVSDDEINAINLTCDEFHGEWNYTISPSLNSDNSEPGTR